MSATSLRDRLLDGQTLYGAWSVIPSAISARALAGSGVDYVVIDLQHGAAGERDLPELTDAVRIGGATPLGRVRHAHPADIGRALDLGCAGVIIPNVESSAQAGEIIGACRYPPAGYRSGGGIMADDADPLCVVMVESRAAVADLPRTVQLDGVDAIYVGPRDLSLSLGSPLDPADPRLGTALDQIWSCCAAAGKPVGVHASDGQTARWYRDRGCRLVTVASDAVAIAAEACRQAGIARDQVASAPSPA
jgi:4-hydroxy-2-oxoheptanedioate aldolase